ncbi:MAG: hypothetical protein MMC23_000643 [Stictis urceolatum]|nr:hypothetical protein [Stictis urceolata]
MDPKFSVTPTTFSKFFYKEGNSVLAIATVAFEWPPPKDGGIYKISDILYFGYKHMAEQVKAEYKDLKTLFVANCYNKDTEKLVQHYFDGKSKRITDYPGQVFRMTVKEPGLDGKAPEPTDGERWEQEVARAFFGSPNGLVLGWLLINRLDDFKGRTVPSVRVWSQDPLHPQLQLTLEDIKG